MGLMDKLKNLFKKKEAHASGCSCGCEGKKKGAAPKGYAAEFTGSDNVSKSLNCAASKIDAKLADGKLSESAAKIFYARLKDIQASGDSEESKLIQISQTIGGIINA